MNNLVLETKKLTKHYGDFVAVSDLNLSIKKGEALLSHKTAPIDELPLELQRRDVAHGAVILEIPVEVIALPANYKNISAFAILV